MEKGPAKWWAVSSRIPEAQLPCSFARLGVEDSNMVLANMSVRPVKLARAMHCRPIEDAVIQVHGCLRRKSRSNQVPPAEPFNNLPKHAILWQLIHVRPTRISIWWWRAGLKIW
eukprot:CAMPEP_0114676026 /NCGR_PEP_ID=MMETSP0191-20121206/48681_1 /TAXON_ID=126664 /ORGANISM="Sorites sp." /LENGTH=113 /DNA_ID=CAMNT_0001946327 /DNA_START=207 /DNA_END=548 /DNA_ORIENTATION=+